MTHQAGAPVPSPSVAEELATEGLLGGFFRLLWEKGGHLGQTRVPHTVVLRYRRPVSWYFTCKEGAVKRKHRKRLVAAEVCKALGKGAVLRKQGGSEDFLEEAEAVRAVLDCPPAGCCVLQEVVENKQGTPPCYEVRWTPYTCCVDEEGYGARKSPHLARRLVLEAADGVARHLQSLATGSSLRSAELRFRVDKRNIVWILSCTSLTLGTTCITLRGADCPPVLKQRTARPPPPLPPPVPASLACVLCGSVKDVCFVSRGAVMFPLQLLDYFSRHPSGVRFSEDRLWEKRVPACAGLLDPSAGSREDFRRGGSVQCCSACVDGLIGLTKKVNVDQDGSITAPFRNCGPRPVRLPPLQPPQQHQHQHQQRPQQPFSPFRGSDTASHGLSEVPPSSDSPDASRSNCVA